MTTTAFSTPESAESAFYRAFESADVAAMMAVWDAGDDILCTHPMGAALVGRNEVEQSWKAILANEVRMRFLIEPVQSYRNGDIAVRVVVEHISIPDNKRVAPMVSTNVYRQTEAGWRMIAHHASPAPNPHASQNESSRLH